MSEIKDLVKNRISIVWNEEIIKNNSLATPQQNNPQAFILGGQPGAGKSKLINIAGNSLNQNIIVINGDDLRKYHPNYKKFQQKYQQDAPKYTADFAGAMTEAILQKAMDEKYNIVIEGTFRTAQTPINTLQNFKNNGYKTNVLIQTCDKNISWNSCLERYEKMLEVNPKEARYTDKAHHDIVIQNLSKNIEEVQKSGLVDNMRIFVRSFSKTIETKNKLEQREVYNSQTKTLVDPANIDTFLGV